MIDARTSLTGRRRSFLSRRRPKGLIIVAVLSASVMAVGVWVSHFPKPVDVVQEATLSEPGFLQEPEHDTSTSGRAAITLARPSFEEAAQRIAAFYATDEIQLAEDVRPEDDFDSDGVTNGQEVVLGRDPCYSEWHSLAGRRRLRVGTPSRYRKAALTTSFADVPTEGSQLFVDRRGDAIWEFRTVPGLRDIYTLHLVSGTGLKGRNVVLKVDKKSGLRWLDIDLSPAVELRVRPADEVPGAYAISTFDDRDHRRNLAVDRKERVSGSVSSFVRLLEEEGDQWFILDEGSSPIDFERVADQLIIVPKSQVGDDELQGRANDLREAIESGQLEVELSMHDGSKVTAVVQRSSWEEEVRAFDPKDTVRVFLPGAMSSILPTTINLEFGDARRMEPFPLVIQFSGAFKFWDVSELIVLRRRGWWRPNQVFDAIEAMGDACDLHALSDDRVFCSESLRYIFVDRAR